MRSKRTDRRELKQTLARLEAENAALRQRLTAESQAKAETSAAQSPPVVTSPSQTVPPVPAIAKGGYPTRAAPLKAKTLKEAKEILMNTVGW